jgi:hypothetical protein
MEMPHFGVVGVADSLDAEHVFDLRVKLHPVGQKLEEVMVHFDGDVPFLVGADGTGACKRIVFTNTIQNIVRYLTQINLVQLRILIRGCFDLRELLGAFRRFPINREGLRC